jgi:hypothetical protein
MSKKSRLLLAVVLALVLALMPVAPLGADTLTAETVTEPIIQPLWYNVSWTYVELTFPGNNVADCLAIIQGLTGTTRITAIVMLERWLPYSSSWYLVKVWRGVAADGSLLIFDQSHSPVNSGYLYRLTINAKVTRYGVIEDVTAYDLTYYD